MPPPPVWGAAVGYDEALVLVGCAYVNESDGEAAGDALADADGDPLADADADAGRDADPLADAEALAPPFRADADAETDGENIAGCADDGEDDGEDVQAVAAAATHTVKTAAPATFRAVLPAAPAWVVRTFMKPPTECLLLATLRPRPHLHGMACFSFDH